MPTAHHDRLETCTAYADLALARTIKRRVDAAARGETTMVTMTEANDILRDRQKARRGVPSSSAP